MLDITYKIALTNMAAVRNFKVKSEKFNTSIHFFDAFAKLRKATVSFVTSVPRPFVRPSSRMERVNSHQKDFREILYLEVQKIQGRLRSDTSSTHLTQKFKVG